MLAAAGTCVVLSEGACHICTYFSLCGNVTFHLEQAGMQTFVRDHAAALECLEAALSVCNMTGDEVHLCQCSLKLNL